MHKSLVENLKQQVNKECLWLTRNKPTKAIEVQMHTK